MLKEHSCKHRCTRRWIGINQCFHVIAQDHYVVNALEPDIVEEHIPPGINGIHFVGLIQLIKIDQAPVVVIHAVVQLQAAVNVK